MAYNNGFPVGYPQMYYPQQNYSQAAFNQPQVQSNGIIWVQGEAGAKSYLVAPGQSLLLMDSESENFYIKSSDTSGMPMPLRKFTYKEVTERTQSEPVRSFNLDSYVTKEELESRLKRLKIGGMEAEEDE